ncbi:hypothetical protein B7494_g1305 [Chlorociboria aeruginascens]|nr:hypothetical protein B7494_g1305 [Chlorociboria aeruginascens]
MAYRMAPNLRRVATESQAGRYARAMVNMAHLNQEIGETPIVSSKALGLKVSPNGIDAGNIRIRSPAEPVLRRLRTGLVNQRYIGNGNDDDNMIVDGPNDAQFIARNTQGLRRGGYGVPSQRDLGGITNLSRPLYTNSAPQLPRNTEPHMGRYNQQYPVTNTFRKLMPWNHSRSQRTQDWQYPQTGPQDTRDIQYN